MFKTTIKSENIKAITSALLAMVREAKLDITPEGIAVKAVDAANVAMVYMDIKKEAFDSYEATEGELGIDIAKLDGLLDMAEKDSMVELELDEVAHKLNVKMGTLKYTMALLDPSTIRKSPKVPNLDLPGIIILKGEDIRRGIKAGSGLSDYISISIVGEACIMEADGDTDAVKLEIQKADLIELTNNGTKDVKSLYSLDYLDKIGKIAAKVLQVTINIGQDFPCKIGFDMLEGNGNVTYMIAPRVESN